MNSPAIEGTSLDRILGGRLQLRQPIRGHRAGTDAVLLAAFVDVRPGQTVVDLGAGVGTVGLILALREPRLRVVLIERDPRLAALAEENAALNDLQNRVEVRARDAFAKAPSLGADLVVCNPPFYPSAAAQPSPDSGRAQAHHLGPRSHGDWLGAAMSQARDGGRLALINRPDALADLLGTRAHRLGDVVLRPVYPKPGRPASRILMMGTIGSRTPLTVRAPLVLHAPDGAFTPEAAAIHEGRTMAECIAAPA